MKITEGMEIITKYQLPNEERQLSKNENYHIWKICSTKGVLRSVRV